MKAIVLIGYMCVGKTTIGKDLAKHLGLRFYDLDWYIEERFRKKVPQIFAEEGEARFHERERRMLHETAEFHDVVLSCGGGTPCYFDNMDYMNSVAETIYLKASSETILQHLAVSRAKRPLLENKNAEELRQFVTEQLAAREPYYCKAKHVIDVNVLDSFDKVETVINYIKDALGIDAQTTNAPSTL